MINKEGCVLTMIIWPESFIVQTVKDITKIDIWK